MDQSAACLVDGEIASELSFGPQVGTRDCRGDGLFEVRSGFLSPGFTGEKNAEIAQHCVFESHVADLARDRERLFELRVCFSAQPLSLIKQTEIASRVSFPSLVAEITCNA